MYLLFFLVVISCLSLVKLLKFLRRNICVLKGLEVILCSFFLFMLFVILIVQILNFWKLCSIEVFVFGLLLMLDLLLVMRNKVFLLFFWVLGMIFLMVLFNVRCVVVLLVMKFKLFEKERMKRDDRRLRLFFIY